MISGNDWAARAEVHSLLFYASGWEYRFLNYPRGVVLPPRSLEKRMPGGDAERRWRYCALAASRRRRTGILPGLRLVSPALMGLSRGTLSISGIPRQDGDRINCAFEQPA